MSQHLRFPDLAPHFDRVAGLHSKSLSCRIPCVDLPEHMVGTFRGAKDEIRVAVASLESPYVEAPTFGFWFHVSFYHSPLTIVSHKLSCPTPATARSAGEDPDGRNRWPVGESKTAYNVTTVGPPTTGSHVLDEIWKDALGGVFKCTVAGTPGTWKQILAAAVTADPAAGTIPTGYLILNVTQGTLKRHAGSYDWQTVIGATGGKIGFWGVTPVTQPAGAGQAAVTLGNADGEIGSLTISDPPTQAELQALRDKCEELGDDVRTLSTLVHALRGHWSRWGWSRVDSEPATCRRSFTSCGWRLSQWDDQAWTLTLFVHA